MTIQQTYSINYQPNSLNSYFALKTLIIPLFIFYCPTNKIYSQNVLQQCCTIICLLHKLILICVSISKYKYKEKIIIDK